MKCYVCMMTHGMAKDSVGVCRFCQVGLCLDHWIEATEATQGGIHYTCNHSLAVKGPS